MAWTRQSFAEEAINLYHAIHQHQEHTAATIVSKFTSEWKLRTFPEKDLVLLENTLVCDDPVAPPSATTTISNQDNDVIAIEDNLDIDHEDWLVDDTIVVDEDQVVPQTRHQHDTLTWTFSIVFSDTWTCPMLYFWVEHHGSPVTSRDTVVELLRHQHHQNQVLDTFEFVSMEEHPVYPSRPCFFLHPCQTLERMNLLQHVDPNSRNNNNNNKENSKSRLWSWMSMMLPAVGISVSAREYVSIQKRLP